MTRRGTRAIAAGFCFDVTEPASRESWAFCEHGYLNGSHGCEEEQAARIAALEQA